MNGNTINPPISEDAVVPLLPPTWGLKEQKYLIELAYTDARKLEVLITGTHERKSNPRDVLSLIPSINEMTNLLHGSLRSN